MSQSRRRSALAAIMLAVLLVGTGAAWLIVLARSPLRPGETWYVITRGDAPVGWRVVQRQSRAGGGEEGYDIIVENGDVPSFARSQWRLDAEGTRGQYASQIGQMPRGRVVAPDGITRIDYDHPILRLRRELGRGRVGVVEPMTVDDSYIPEGRLRPVIVQVAETGNEFTGTMVVDHLLALKPLVLEPVGETTREVEGRSVSLTVVALQWLMEEWAGRTLRYFVDADGSIAVIERESDGRVVQTLTRTSLDEVRRRFPDAHRVRSLFLREPLLD